MKPLVLVVDDDLDILTQTTTVLKEYNFSTETATNITDAEKILIQQEVSLIILDVMMDKDSDGFNFAQKLNRDERFKKIPIIMVTSINQKSSFKFGKETDGDFLPVDKFMEKPVDPVDLIQFVQELALKN